MTILYQSERFSQLPAAVLLDLDNTLYPYLPAHNAALQMVRHKISKRFNIDAQNFEQSFSQAQTQVKVRLEGTAAAHSRLLYFQSLFEILGLSTQVRLALEFEQAYWGAFLSQVILFDEAIAFLDDLRLMNIPTALVTDLTAQIQFRKLIYFGLDHYFDHVVTSEEAGYDKPHPAPFQIALEKLRPAGNCFWMIGDHPVKDIQGARDSIGAVTLQKCHEGVELGNGEQTPDAAFHEFKELRKLLARINPVMQ